MTTNRDKLVALQFIYKKAAEQVSTKDPNNLRGLCDQEVIKAYEETGAKQFALQIGGIEVGTYSVTLTKPTEETTKREIRINDSHAFGEWIKSCDREVLEDWARVTAYEFASHVIEETGEVPSGVNVYVEVVPGDTTRHVKGTTLRLDSDKALAAIASLPAKERENLLLGGV